MPTGIFSAGYKKKPTTEPAGSPGAKQLEPGVYLPPEESLPDYSPTEATPSSAIAGGIVPLDHQALHEAAVKRVESKQTSVVNNLLAAPLPGKIAPANIGASSQYATPNEEGKLEVKPLSAFAPEKSKPQKPEPLSTERAIAAFEEQGTPPHMAAKLATNPAVVQQLEETLAMGYGNTPHQTEGKPEPGNPQVASSAIISSDPKNKQHQDLLAAAQNKPQHIAHANHEVAQQLGHLGLDPQKVGALVKAGKAYGVSPALLAAIGNVESTNGTSTLPGVSSGQNSAGAAGPFQIGNGTGDAGDWWHENMPANANIYDYNTAAMGAAKYLSDAGATEDPNTWYNAALSYNHAGWYAEEVSNLAKEASSAPWSGASPASVPSTTSEGPEPVPKGARKYFEDDGAHLRFVPTFAHHLEKLAKLSGEPVDINEGFRTEPEQAHLYELYQNGEGNLAAPPGGSEHEKGLAADAQLTSHQRELLSAAGLDLPVPGEDWHLQLSEPSAIEQADQESATPVPGVASPLTSTATPVESPGTPIPVGETSASTGAELLAQHKQKAPAENKPSLAMQLLFGGGEDEDPVNALLNSPLPSFGSPGISGDLSNEDLLKLLLERT